MLLSATRGRWLSSWQGLRPRRCRYLFGRAGAVPLSTSCRRCRGCVYRGRHGVSRLPRHPATGDAGSARVRYRPRALDARPVTRVRPATRVRSSPPGQPG